MKKHIFIGLVAATIVVSTAIVTSIAVADDAKSVPERPEGPCDIYAKGGAPCVAAHSSTRALFASYNGPLYQVMRQSDGKTLDIGVVSPSAGDAGGYADAEAQDEFCANTTCWITILYDQTGKGNDLKQAPRGAFSGPALGGFNNLPIADMAPVTLSGHKVYGIFIVPGMGLRQNDTHGIAVDDQAEGQYWVINGHHFNSGCCFDYGNAETDSRDDGDGTMETTYYGNNGGWYSGSGSGPWIMTDQENNLVGCVNEDPDDRHCETLQSVSWRFVTATADGESHHWRTMGGNAQEGELLKYYDGGRIRNDKSSYDPMRKQGAILLGNGGDNSNGSTGTFYEGAMTAAGTFPSEETNQAIQANIVAAKYDVQRLAISPTAHADKPDNQQTFVPGTTGYTTVTFVNTTGETIDDLSLGIEAPKGWKVAVAGSQNVEKRIDYDVLPGQTVVVDFTVTTTGRSFSGDMYAHAAWTSANARKQSEKATLKVRNVAPVKINEFRICDGVNMTDSFIELYNSGDNTIDISGWELSEHAAKLPKFSTIRIDKDTKLAPRSYYVLALSTSGLAVKAAKGDQTLHVRDVTGMKVGDEITIGTGDNAEKHTIAAINAPEPVVVVPRDPQVRPKWVSGRVLNPIGTPTTVWQPLPDGPVMKVPAGSKSISVDNNAWFKVGDKMAIGYGATYPAATAGIEEYEVVTVTAVGKSGIQTYLAYDAKPGDRNIKLAHVEDVSPGDILRLDIDSEGHGVEYVKVKAVGTASKVNPGRGPMPLEDAGTGVTLTKPLKYAHSANMPVSVHGTGISFTPATKFDHYSNEPVLALPFEIVLDKPLTKDHAIEEAILDASDMSAGYQGEYKPDQYFGGPAFDREGNMTLYDTEGNVVDCLNWDSVVEPIYAEGYQGQSGHYYGNYVEIEVPEEDNPDWRMPGSPILAGHNLSAGRYPDGSDLDDNAADFRTQSTLSLYYEIPAGTQTITVTAADDIKPGQTFYIGHGANVEPAKITTIGETKTLSEVLAIGTWVRTMTMDVMEVTLARPLNYSHAAGESMVDNLPTPGYPNRY